MGRLGMAQAMDAPDLLDTAVALGDFEDPLCRIDAQRLIRGLTIGKQPFRRAVSPPIEA
jgi:hypothetical protein